MINQKSLKEIRKTTGTRKMTRVEKQLLQLSKRPNLKKLIQNK